MKDFKCCEQDPMEGFDDFTPESLFDLTFSPLHLGVRAGEHCIRLACLLFTFGIVSGQTRKNENQCEPKHPLTVQSKAKKPKKNLTR